ncbi:MAG TPA: magnesium transporter CorA family protein [Streptosporangiaceae bacterium]|nr:magnesium transporter CorA family protein [Streptosporangiaceae bacterium]
MADVRSNGRRDREDDLAPASICSLSPTRCQARTRVYSDGKLAAEGFPVGDISEYLKDESAFVWLDLLAPDRADLAVLSEEFGLHPLAIEDAVMAHERTKIDRYQSHLFLAAYVVHLHADSGELDMSEIAAFITTRALITVRKGAGVRVDSLIAYWDGSPDLAAEGVGYLVHGLLDNIVDGYFSTVQVLDDEIEKLEDLLFATNSRDQGAVQRRSFELRKSLVFFRRVVLPMREVVNTVLRRDLHIVTGRLQPYYQDVYDHVLRATEWTESLRDLVTTILETNLTVQSNRMNVITKKVTSWAAIIAVPTLVTGIYGMNVPYPGFGHAIGFDVSAAVMTIAAVTLYLIFRRKDWL